MGLRPVGLCLKFESFCPSRRCSICCRDRFSVLAVTCSRSSLPDLRTCVCTRKDFFHVTRQVLLLLKKAEFDRLSSVNY